MTGVVKITATRSGAAAIERGCVKQHQYQQTSACISGL